MDGGSIEAHSPLVVPTAMAVPLAAPAPMATDLDAADAADEAAATALVLVACVVVGLPEQPAIWGRVTPTLASSTSVSRSMDG